MRLRFVAATAVMFASCLPAFADSITYNFSQTVGSESAIGTITTDGKVGTLSQSDILSFTLKLMNGSTTVTSGSTASTILAGNALSATLEGLFFNYSGTGGLGLLADSSYANYLCFSAGTTCSGNGTTNIQLATQGVTTTSAKMTGSAQIGQVSSAVTPEPSSLVLLATGIIGLFALSRRKLFA